MQIGSQGAYWLAVGLASCTSLLVLGLQNNEIGPLGARSLASSLEDNRSLSVVLLSYNR